jgi:trehalose 6-phosphate phosphatase
VPIAASRTTFPDTGCILRRVPANTAETMAELLRPLTAAPKHAAIFCDIDGTLAPIVRRAEDARVPDTTARLLGTLGRRYGLVACITGRSVAEARRLVGVGTVSYAGVHGAEVLGPGASKPTLESEFARYEKRVRRFVAEQDTRDIRLLRIRVEDKGPIQAFHWRGAPDEDAARTRIEGIAQEAEAEGFITHWGRKVLEIRPPVPVDKGRAVDELLRRAPGVRTAMYAGDDATDVDAWAALDRHLDEGRLDARVRVGVASDEGPAEIRERADLVVDGIPGFANALEVLAS